MRYFVRLRPPAGPVKKKKRQSLDPLLTVAWSLTPSPTCAAADAWLEVQPPS